MHKTAFIFGLGFVGVECARLLLGDGWQVAATTRSGGWDKTYARLPHDIALFPFTAGEDWADANAVLAEATHIISTIPPHNGRDPVLPVLAANNITPLWTGYVSATSVYSEAGGGWVDETSPTNPTTSRGQNRLAAEGAWQAQNSFKAEIFRAAGIYGAGRSVLDKLRAGTARSIIKPGHFFNRIHVTDLARIIVAAMAKPRAGRILNCADGNPTQSGEVTREASKLLGLPPPPEVAFADADLSPMAKSFYASSRRVNNTRIQQELGLALLYPDYKQGLAAVLAAET